MKILSTLCILSLVTSPLHAEPTPAGGVPTYTNSNGGFTYYYIDGTPVPPGTKIFLGMDPRGGMVMNDKGQSTGVSVYDTKERAADAYKSQGSSDCSGAVVGPTFGPGPGCSGSSSGGGSGEMTEVDESDYNKKVYELAVMLYGATEIGAKSCKGAGAEVPASLSSWWTAVKTYMSGEAKRDQRLKDRLSAIEKKMMELTKGDGSELQVEAIQLQIDSVEASIESVNGSIGRIPLREKLILAALKSIETNGKENTATMDAYFNLRDKSLQASLDAAKAGCERKKKVQKCETDAEGNESCSEVEVSDPVPGCDVALAQIPVMKAGALQSYGEVYLSRMQSTPLNDRMQMFADQLKDTMASIPRSNDANYDWSTPMETGLESLEKARKKSGAKCLDGKEAEDELEKLAKDKAEYKKQVETGITEVSGNKDDAVKEKFAELEKNLSVPTKRVRSAAETFMTQIGVGDNEDVKSGFLKAWKETDAVIGQAANRPEYFDFMTEKTNALLEIDRVKLQNLLAAKEKLETFLSNLKKTLAQGTGTNGSKASLGGTASGGATTTAANTPKKVSLGSQAQQSNQVSAASHGVNAQAAALQKASSSALSLSDMKATSSLSGVGSKVQNGVSKFSSASVNSVDGLSLSGSSMAIAKKTMSNIAQNNKKLLAAQNAILPSTRPNSGGSSSSASKEKAKIASTASGYQGAHAGRSSTTLGDNLDSAFDKFKDSATASEVYKAAAIGGVRNYGSDSYGGSSYGGGGSSSRRFYEKTVGYSSPTTKSSSEKSSGAREGASVGSYGADSDSGYAPRELTSDAKVLSQTIKAKKLRKQDEYQARDSDSLFERVTKAYIRSYEKVEDEQ